MPRRLMRHAATSGQRVCKSVALHELLLSIAGGTVIIPFYLNWTFWAVVVSTTAIILSQLPPIHLLLRPRRIEVEVHSRVQVTHRAGNPNVGLVVSLTNSGGRNLRIRSINLELSRDGKPLANLPAQNYFETLSSTSTVLLVPFLLKPGESWAHGVNFLNFFDRHTEKHYRECLSALNTDIRQKVNARPKGSEEMVVADPKVVAPFLELFDKLFVWQTGEYVISLSVTTSPESASYSKMYRFTLYESDTDDLKKHTDDYKYGGGITFDIEQHVMTSVPLTEHVG